MGAPRQIVFRNGSIATMVPKTAPYGAIADGALVAEAGLIAWVGSAGDVPERFAEAEIIDLEGGWLLPGLIDCHTHLVFAGDRSAEFEARLGGLSYEEAARAGRGILSTVAAVRDASEEDLVRHAWPRLDRLAAEGVTTVEIKSGYGLSLEAELKMLRAARRLGDASGVRVRTSLLAAHAVPPEFAGQSDAYVELIVRDIIPAASAAGLADAVDAFCENIAFTPAQTARVFEAARAAGLHVKLHADQLSDSGGAALAAAYGALSADHLEYTSEAGAAALSRSGCVAVLLPGAYATVGAVQPPPVATFRAHGVPMAVATDCNPGSSPMSSLLMAANLACCLFRLTPEEALAGITREAARALGLDSVCGTLIPGAAADLTIWNIGHPRELAYWMGGLAPRSVWRAGQTVTDRSIAAQAESQREIAACAT